MEQNVFSRIPLRTWNWLGVNEARLPDGLQKITAKGRTATPAVETLEESAAGTDGKDFIKTGTGKAQRFFVAAGETAEKIAVFRKEELAEICAEVAEGGTLCLTCIQLAPEDRAFAGKVRIRAAKDAKVKFTAVEAGASETVTELRIELEGDGASADVAVAYFGDGERKIDMNYIIVQQGKDTEADMQARGVLKDASDKIFRGALDFRRGSKGSAGREKEDVVLLNEGVRNRSVPLMLSQEDAVNGQHAVSAGRLDRAKWFYLMSRGLDEKAAQKLMAGSLFAPVLERIPDTELQREIMACIEERIADGEV